MADYGWLDAYLLAMPGATKDFKAEWEWWRYQVGGRLFAATMSPGSEHKPPYAGKDLLSLKCDPLYSEHLRAEHSAILPGFYANKRHWISLVLDGSLGEDLVRELCSHSYELVFSKLTKKLQREIIANVTGR